MNFKNNCGESIISAIEGFKQALRIEPNTPGAKINLLSACLESRTEKHFKEALDLAQQINTDHAKFLIGCAYAHIHDEREKAKEILLSIKDTQDVTIQKALFAQIAAMYESEDNYNKQLEYLNKQIALGG